jgi:hypothetical protein
MAAISINKWRNVMSIISSIVINNRNPISEINNGNNGINEMKISMKYVSKESSISTKSVMSNNNNGIIMKPIMKSENICRNGRNGGSCGGNGGGS